MRASLLPLLGKVKTLNTAATIFVAALAATGAQAQSIYSCVDAKGNKRTSDRPIPECSDREQRVLNKDGTVKRIALPTQTPKTEQEAASAAKSSGSKP
jgi:hypothetical protein